MGAGQLDPPLRCCFPSDFQEAAGDAYTELGGRRVNNERLKFTRADLKRAGENQIDLGFTPCVNSVVDRGSSWIASLSLMTCRFTTHYMCARAVRL